MASYNEPTRVRFLLHDKSIQTTIIFALYLLRGYDSFGPEIVHFPRIFSIKLAVELIGKQPNIFLITPFRSTNCPCPFLDTTPHKDLIILSTLCFYRNSYIQRRKITKLYSFNYLPPLIFIVMYS